MDFDARISNDWPPLQGKRPGLILSASTPHFLMTALAPALCTTRRAAIIPSAHWEKHDETRLGPPGDRRCFAHASSPEKGPVLQQAGPKAPVAGVGGGVPLRLLP